MSVILTAALAGAVGGAIGGGLAWLVERRLRRRPTWLNALPIACALLAAGLIRFGGPAEASGLMAELDRQQNVGLLKLYYPDDYARLTQRIEALPASADRAEVEAVVAEAVGAVIARQRPKADDESVLQMYAVGRAEGAALKALSPAACSAFLDGVGRREDLAKVMTPELHAQDLAAARQLLIQTVARPAPPATAMTPEAFATFSLPALAKLADADQDLVIRVLQEERSSQTEPEHRAMCDFYLAQADLVLADPPAIAGPRIRAIWAME